MWEKQNMTRGNLEKLRKAGHVHSKKKQNRVARNPAERKNKQTILNKSEVVKRFVLHIRSCNSGFKGVLNAKIRVP